MYSFLTTPDMLFRNLVLDNKIVGKYTAAYLDNTESSILAGKPANTRCTGADSVSGHTAVSALGWVVLSFKVLLHLKKPCPLGVVTVRKGLPEGMTIGLLTIA